MESLSISAIYLPLFGILFVLITGRVGILRIRKRLSSGDGGDDDFRKVMRAQMNFTESTPLALMLIVLAEYRSAPSLLVHSLFSLLLIGRSLHYLQLTGTIRPIMFRMMGMLFTLVIMLAASGWLLLAQ